MVKRLIVGLFLGSVLGAILAAVLVQVLKVVTFDASALGPAGAYLAAALTGVITGFVAGKPIWSADGKIEAGLKAFFGALLALGGMFVLRKWVHVPVDLGALKAGAGEVGQLPATALPIIAGLLAAFFELDNNGAQGDDEKKAGPGAKAKVRVATEESAEEEDESPRRGADEEDAPAKAKRR